jgi:hypothetical protein
VKLRQRVAALRALAWAWRAALDARRQVAAGELPPLDLPPVPKVPLSAEYGVHLALQPRLFTCLVRASVRQAWLSGHGVARDLVIGVTEPGEFKAHAWLEGDPPHGQAGYLELLRRPA